MQPVEQELSNAYQHLFDDEIASLYVQFDSLTEAARKALSAEIKRRGLAGPQLEKMHANEVRREDGFDRREKVRRKGLASWLLFRDDPMGTVITFLLLVLFLLISAFIARHR